MALTQYFEPARMTEQRATGQIPFDSISRSYFLMRTLVGFLGLALPAILFIGEYFLDDASIGKRGSLSAYYHSGMRDFFVIILAVVGILLVTYKITERNRDNLLSSIAGIAAIVAAIFPTGIPSGIEASLTPLQARLGEANTERIHYSAAAIFIVSVGFICYDFAQRERQRPQEREGHDAIFPPTFWYSFHLLMAALIFLAIVFIVVTQVFDVFDKHSILIGETVVTVAFGLSWLAKGLDRNALPKMMTW